MRYLLRFVFCKRDEVEYVLYIGERLPTRFLEENAWSELLVNAGFQGWRFGGIGRNLVLWGSRNGFHVASISKKVED